MFAALAIAAEQLVGDMNAQDIASTIWAFATVNQYEKKLFTALTRAADRRVGDFNAEDLANTA